MHSLSILKTHLSLELVNKISSFVASIVLLVLSPHAFAETAKPDLTKMSVEQKVGQTMIWSFAQTEFDTDFQDMLSRYQPGALIVFRRNIKTPLQIGELNSQIQKFMARKAKAPLFIMVDQEGGVVTRIRINTPIPSALALGKTEDPKLVQNFAKVQADLLQALGFNVNLAPVLDLSNPKQASFIGNRTFGNDPDLVAKLGLAYSRGVSQAGLMPTAKHFPGHGGIEQDSHKTVPTKLITPEDFEAQDFVPFQEFASISFPRAVMTAHMSLPNLDPSGTPATYSKIILDEYLRKKLNYGGLVLTDDLEMSGAASENDIGERAVKAFLAGNDMMILAGSFARQKRAFRAVVAAVKEGRISQERLDQSVMRILEAKAQLKIAPFKVDARKAADAMKKLTALSKDVMNKNFKVALEEAPIRWPSNEEQTLPAPIPVFSSSPGFYRSFNANYPTKSRHYPLTPKTLDGVTRELAKEETPFAIFYASGTTTARWLSQLVPELRAKLIVVNCNDPGSVENQNTFMSVLNLNSHSPESGQWLAEALVKAKSEKIPVEPILDSPAPEPANPMTTPLSDDLESAPREMPRTPAGDEG